MGDWIGRQAMHSLISSVKVVSRRIPSRATSRSQFRTLKDVMLILVLQLFDMQARFCRGTPGRGNDEAIRWDREAKTVSIVMS
jgi:hypothetical protein